MSGPVDPRGPIQPIGKPPIVGRQSVQSALPPKAISPDDRGPQTGKWMWTNETTKKTVRFRKSLSLDDDPTQIRAWIAADVRYRMWVNGKLASRGPADVGRDYDSGPCGPWFEDVRDLTRFFHRGKNVVAVEVFAEPVVGSESSTGHPGFKVNLDVRSEESQPKSIGSDASWKCAIAEDLDQSSAKNGFRADLNREPIGWRTTDFDDAKWPSAVISANQIPTIVSELAPPLEAELKPIGVTRVSDGVIANARTGGAIISKNGGYSVQYGHVLSGYVGLKVKGHKGARLHIMPNEHDAPGHNRQFEVVLRDGEQFFEVPYFDSFSVINIRAEGVSDPIEIQDVRCVFTSYPVRYTGSFSCSRPDFNRLWEVCRWCTQICMQTHHLDSPHHQEPVSDAGDYLIESLNAFYGFGDGTLARQDLKKIARNLTQRKYQSFHTSYSLLWLQMLLQYYDYTGDAKCVEELSPVVFALLDQFEKYIGTHGLISESPNYMFMDWVEIEGFTLHHPPAVIGQGYMTAVYYRALADGIRVAELLHDTQRVEKCQALRAGISKAFERELWVPEKGLYRDGKAFQTATKPNQWLPADRDIETFSTQGNTFAVACGLVPADRAKVVMDNLLSRTDLRCQPYFMHFVFQALAASGEFDKYAVKQIERWQIVPDTQSFLEMWDTGDLSHAWIGTPMVQMSGMILGITPIEPGFKRFQIAPHPCGLEWAKGTVPTPIGNIDVSWKKMSNKFEITFRVPKGSNAILKGVLYGPGNHTVKVSDQ